MDNFATSYGESDKIKCVSGNDLVSDGYISQFFYGRYSDVILSRKGTIAAGALYVLYLIGAIFGLANLEEGEPSSGNSHAWELKGWTEWT